MKDTLNEPASFFPSQLLLDWLNNWFQCLLQQLCDRFTCIIHIHSLLISNILSSTTPTLFVCCNIIWCCVNSLVNSINLWNIGNKYIYDSEHCVVNKLEICDDAYASPVWRTIVLFYWYIHYLEELLLHTQQSWVLILDSQRSRNIWIENAINDICTLV